MHRNAQWTRLQIKMPLEDIKKRFNPANKFLSFEGTTRAEIQFKHKNPERIAPASIQKMTSSRHLLRCWGSALLSSLSHSDTCNTRWSQRRLPCSFYEDITLNVMWTMLYCAQLCRFARQQQYRRWKFFIYVCNKNTSSGDNIFSKFPWIEASVRFVQRCLAPVVLFGGCKVLSW